jgi:hypothetical protein
MFFTINPETKTLKMMNVENDDSYKFIRGFIGGMITAIRLDEDHTLYVADEGLLNRDLQVGFFMIKEHYQNPLVGKAVICKTNKQGESIDPSLDFIHSLKIAMINKEDREDYNRVAEAIEESTGFEIERAS